MNQNDADASTVIEAVLTEIEGSYLAQRWLWLARVSAAPGGEAAVASADVPAAATE